MDIHGFTYKNLTESGRIRYRMKLKCIPFPFLRVVF